MKSVYRIVLLLASCLVLVVACGDPAQKKPPLPEGESFIPDTTHVIDANTREALLEYDSDTGIMRFSATTDVLKALQPGDVIVSEPSSAAPYGYLRKVSGVQADGKGFVVNTEQAALTDAIYRANIDFEREMEPDDLLEPEILVPGLTIAAVIDPEAVGFNFVAHFDETVLNINEGGVASQVRVDGSVSFNLGFNFGLSIDGDWWPPDIYVTRFETSANISQRTELHVSGNANATFEKDVQVAEIPFNGFCIPAGIPLCFFPTMYMFVGASGQVNLEFDYGVVQSISAGIGTRYVRGGPGNGWKNLGHGPDFNTSVVSSPSVSAGLTARAFGRAEIGLMLYGVAGPTFGAILGVELDAAIPRNPTWKLNGFLEAYFGLVLRFPILGRFADHRATIFEISEEITRSQNAPPTIEVRQPNVRIDYGYPIEFSSSCNSVFCARDLEDGYSSPPGITLTSNRDGVLPKGAYTFPSTGARTITVSAVDSKGATATATFSVNVVNSPPELSLLDYSSIGYTNDTYFLTAAVTDTNEPENGGLCKNATWEVSEPDTLSVARGCQVQITWGELGARTVRVSAEDSDGLTVTSTVTVDVRSPFIHPRLMAITGIGLTSQELSFNPDPFIGLRCVSVSVEGGSSIALGDGGCLAAVGHRYSASVDVWSQASQDTLRYDWKVYVGEPDLFSREIKWREFDTTLASPDATFELKDVYGPHETIGPCYVEVTVTGIGTQSNVVWIGTCSYKSGPVVN